MAGDISENNCYFHLVALVVDVCPFILREYFLKLAKEESTKQGQIFQDIKTYLFNNQGRVLFLRKHNRIKQVQLDLINQSCDFEKWDVTLLIALIKGLYSPLSSLVETCLSDISTERNAVAHATLNEPISEDEFHGKWQKLETTIKFMASKVNSESVKKEMENRIQNIKEVRMKGLVARVMQQWLNLKVDEIREELGAVKEDTKKTNEILNDVTVETVESGRGKLKRLRTLSPTLERMQSGFQKFASSMEGKNSDHLNPADVLEYLQMNKRVLISSDSSDNRGLLAIKAIEEMKINQQKCCLMNLPSEWDHVNPDQIEIVVVKDAFGGKEYQPENVKCMKTIAEQDSDVKVIFLTDHDIFLDFKEENGDDFTCQAVEIRNTGTEDNPIELNTATDKTSSDPVLKNMIDHTSCFIKHWSERRVDSSVLQKASKVLKENKVVFIQSKDLQSRRILALRLLSDFKPHRRLLLQSPEDLKHVALGQICIVLIEDFTGRLAFDRQICENWYRTFDFLMADVFEGKLQVIITLDWEKRRYLPKIHPIMEGKDVVVESKDITLKTESLLSDIQGPSDSNNGKIICEGSIISSAAFMPDGSLVLCDHLHNQLILYDKDFKLLAKKKQTDKPFGVCAVNENVVVSFPDQKRLRFFQILHEYKPLKPLSLNREPWGIDVFERTIYTICNDTREKVIMIITLDSDNNATTRVLDTALFGGHIDHYIRVKRGQDCVYLIVTNSEANAVKCLTEHGTVEFQFQSECLQGTEDLYVDMVGNILVCGRTSNNIYFINSDGKEGKILVDGVMKPRCLAYRKSDGALVVGTSSSAVSYNLDVSFSNDTSS